MLELGSHLDRMRPFLRSQLKSPDFKSLFAQLRAEQPIRNNAHDVALAFGQCLEQVKGHLEYWEKDCARAALDSLEMNLNANSEGSNSDHLSASIIKKDWLHDALVNAELMIAPPGERNETYGSSHKDVAELSYAELRGRLDRLMAEQERRL